MSFQLAKFRNLLEGKNEHDEVVALEDNWRPPQPMHDRKVKMSFVPEVEEKIVQEKKEQYKEAASTDNMASAISLSVPITLLFLLIGQFIKH